MTWNKRPTYSLEYLREMNRAEDLAEELDKLKKSYGEALNEAYWQGVLIGYRVAADAIKEEEGKWKK